MFCILSLCLFCIRSLISRSAQVLFLVLVELMQAMWWLMQWFCYCSEKKCGKIFSYKVVISFAFLTDFKCVEKNHLLKREIFCLCMYVYIYIRVCVCIYICTQLYYYIKKCSEVGLIWSSDFGSCERVAIPESFACLLSWLWDCACQESIHCLRFAH